MQFLVAEFELLLLQVDQLIGEQVESQMNVFSVVRSVRPIQYLFRAKKLSLGLLLWVTDYPGQTGLAYVLLLFRSAMVGKT